MTMGGSRHASPRPLLIIARHLGTFTRVATYRPGSLRARGMLVPPGTVMARGFGGMPESRIPRRGAAPIPFVDTPDRPGLAPMSCEREPASSGPEGEGFRFAVTEGGGTGPSLR